MPGCSTRPAIPPTIRNVLFADPPGTILPAGGLDHGHKGYGLALMVEALTMGLGGFGRAEPAEGWGASVFVQLLDPDAFAGGDGLPPPDRVDRRGLPRVRRPGPASSASACRARRRSPGAVAPWPKESSSIPASWSGCGPSGRLRLGGRSGAASRHQAVGEPGREGESAPTPATQAVQPRRSNSWPSRAVPTRPPRK